MTFKKIIVFFCLVLPFTLFGEGTLQLKEQLDRAHVGDYIVTSQNKNYSFLIIREKTQNSLSIDEINIPEAEYASQPLPWKEWYAKGAPGHTNWLQIEINTQTGQFNEIYSLTQKGWVDLSQANPFLTSLLNLPFYKVPESERRRVGKVAKAHKNDRRPIWNPPLVVDGEIIKSIPSTAWKTKWPADGTELAGKIIQIYLPERVDDPSIPPYPTYFPIWIEVEGKLGSVHWRVVEIGNQGEVINNSTPSLRVL